ncbi:MAG: hypothetical protein ABI895_25000 [Deltaproteobacteria bacterium]
MQRSPRNQDWRAQRARRWSCLAGLSGALLGCGGDPPRSLMGQLEPAPPGSAAPSTAAEPPVSDAPEAPLLDSSEEDGSASGAPRFVDEASAAPPPLAPEDACAATAIQAQNVERVVEVPVEEEVVVPSVFYLMLDSSGSMVSDPFTLEGLIEAVLDLFGLGQRPPQPSKWDYTLDGLKTFLGDPASAGLELGLGYFPEGGLCDGTGYDVPSVPLGVLPEQAPALEASLDARQPAGNTPLEGALRGVTDYCLGFNAEHPEASCVAVLITDGAADECDARSADALAAIAANARAGGVLTYAAGMQGADFAVLDAIGAAGGGDCDPDQPGFACNLTAHRQAFVSALESIRDRTRTQTRIEQHIETVPQILPCEWQIPAPPSGASFDPARVNVRLSLASDILDALPHVPAASSCAAAGGWYYDDPSAPQHILACPATCTTLRAEPQSRVDLLFGCKTVLR